MKRSASKIEVDERDAPAGPGERQCEVCDSRRLPLLLHTARHHDGARSTSEVGELEVRPQDSEGFSVGAVRIVEHHQASLFAQLTRWLRNPTEQRETKLEHDRLR